MRQAKLVTLIVASVLTDYGCKTRQLRAEAFRQHKIAFTSIRDGNYEIYVMNADGNGQKNLTNNPDIDTEPRWSPDGKKIAFFLSYRPRMKFIPNNITRTEIYVSNPDGTEMKQLTDTGSDWNPVWSPLPLPAKEP